MASHNLLKSLTESQPDGVGIDGKFLLIKEGKPGGSDTGYMKGAIGINTSIPTLVYDTLNALESTIAYIVDANSAMLWCNAGTPASPDWRSVQLMFWGCNDDWPDTTSDQPPTQQTISYLGKHGCVDPGAEIHRDDSEIYD